MSVHRNKILIGRLALAGVIALASVSPAFAQNVTDDAGLTFFGWSDQHIDVSGDAAHVVPFVDAMNAMEGCARSFALRLWNPMLSTRPAGHPIEQPDLEETWQLIARAPSELLDLVRQRRQSGGEFDAELQLEVLAVRLGGYALDACGEDAVLGRGRGPTAHDTCLWLRKVEGLTDGTRELPASLKTALSALFWRLVDTTRGTALGEVDDVEWLGPFAAWWALVIDRPATL